jgi:hypothetical protein
MFEGAMRKIMAGDQKPILPRDNPVKDFLVSAEAKFASFYGEKPVFGILVIVWNDFIFEPITSLVHEASKGLLTPETFARNADGTPTTFPHVNSVFLVRHLMYFQQGAAETLTERRHAFDFGGEQDLPNVYVPVPGGKEVPDFIRTGLRALCYQDEQLQRFAD